MLTTFIKYPIMKTILLACLLLASAMCGGNTLRIGGGTRFTVSEASDFELECKGAQGDVHYDISGLPDGVEIDGNKIHATAGAKVGDYVIRIVARDGAQRASKIVGLTIEEGSGSTSSTTTEGGSSSGAASGRSSRLSNIISSYSSVTKVSTKEYENNRYPEVDFPTGTSGKIIATVETGDAQTSDQNRNTITADDVALRAASERHQNAVKAITNLITIIDQARANALYAKSSVEKYIQEYNAALVAQRKVQGEIVRLETEATQIQSALDGVIGLINQVTEELAALEAKKADYESEKKSLLEEIAGAETIKAKLLIEIEKTNSKLAELIKQLGAHKEKCQDLKGELDARTAEKKKYEEKYQNIEDLKAKAKIAIKEKTGIVEELRKQLIRAESDLSNAKIELVDLEDQQKGLPQKIEDLAKEIASLTAKLAACQAETQRIQTEIDNTQDSNSDLTEKANELEDEILDLRRRTMELDGLISGTLKPLEELKARIASLEDDLAYLKGEIITAEERLNEAYARGNDANDVVCKARTNVDASNARYEKETRISAEATINLERARAEESLARLAVDELIAKYTSALPYAIVPNGNGMTNPGTPFGNNPSGSPLGAIKTNGNGASGSFKVANWAHYLSQAFGAGVHPSFAGSVTELYPFNFHSSVDGHMVTNSGNLRGGNGDNCAPANGNLVASGSVVSVGESSLRVRLDNSGAEFDVHVNPCTKMNSNKPNYELGAGDEAIFKAHHESGSIVAEKITCLA